MIDNVTGVRHEVRKKSYKRPELETLGSLEEITRGPQGGAIDSLFGGNGGFQDPTPPGS